MKTIIIYGLRRSGNHFLISSIIQQQLNKNKKSKISHINDLNKLDYNKYLEHSKLEIEKDFNNGTFINFKGADLVILSLEDKIPDLEELKKFDENINDLYKFIIIRSPYTNLSSLFEISGKNINSIKDNYINKWIKNYKFYISNENNLIKVFYDKFTENLKYRQNILKNIGYENIIIDDTYIVNYQESSYKDKKKQKQTYKGLYNCSNSDNELFIKLIEQYKILEEYNINLLVLE